MLDNALYVYGIVKSGLNLKFIGNGLNGESVYTVSDGKFSALVHDCEEKPYISENPDKIKELIISHNDILDKAMKNFNGVIPLHFNTIIKKGDNLPVDNLKNWLNNDEERLEKIWDKVKAKKEYGVRIYYEKDKLVQEASNAQEIREIEESQEAKSPGLSYLLQTKAKSKTNEIVLDKINCFKQKFYGDIKKATNDVKINNSRVFIDEEKDLLLSLSVLVEEHEVAEIKKILEKSNGFSFQFAGPFAPYSFVDNE